MCALCFPNYNGLTGADIPDHAIDAPSTGMNMEWLVSYMERHFPPEEAKRIAEEENKKYRFDQDLFKAEWKLKYRMKA
jgi:hypothetical protein